MKKSELRMLGHIFGAEVYAAVNHQPWMRVYQSRSKMIKKLKEMGMVQEARARVGGVLGVTIEGWELTRLGHITYCMSCEDSHDAAGESSK